MIDVSIIIPTYNRLTFIYPTVLCLINQRTDINYEIVIVDSGVDNTEMIIKSLCDIHKVNLVYKKILEAKNRALLRNIGAENANGKYLVFLDNDILVPHDFIQKHYELLLSNKNTIILGKRKSLTNFDLKEFGERNLLNNFSLLDKLPWYRDLREKLLDDNDLCLNDITNQWRFLYSHNFSLEKKIFRKVNGFNEIFGENWGYEDLELGFRLFKNNYCFLLSDEITGYHQTHFEESKIATKQGLINAKLFLSLHNCIEFELYSGFYDQFDKIYDEVLEVQKKCFTRKRIPKIKNTFLLGCLWRYWQNKKLEDGCLGVSLPFIEDKSYDNVFVLNTFFHFSFNIQCAIISEAIRICDNSYITIEKESSDYDVDNLLEEMADRLGYSFQITNETNYKVSFSEISENRYFVISIPDVFDPSSRIKYLSLASVLDENGYTILFSDKKSRNTFSNEYFYLSECTKLEQYFSGQIGNIRFHNIASKDLFRIENIDNEALRYHIAIDDNEFLDETKRKNKCKQYDSVILQTSCYTLIKKEFLLYKPSNNNSEINENKYFVSMDNGFYEDCLDVILDVLCILPKLSLIITIPDYENMWKFNYRDHNLISKYNKSFSTVNKFQKDYLILLKKIDELNLKNRVNIIQKNISLIEHFNYINNTAGIIALSRGRNFSPLIFAALLLQKKVFISDHCYLDNIIKKHCFVVSGKKSLVADEFNIPVSCENINLYCIRTDLHNLYRKIIYSNVIKPPYMNIYEIDIFSNEIIQNFISFIKFKTPAGQMFVEHK